MKEKLQELYDKALSEIAKVNDIDSLQNVRNTYLSKKSELNGFMSKMKELSPEERASFGQLINNIKNDLTQKIESKRNELEEKKLQEKLMNEVIDFTEPNTTFEKGSKHPFNAVVDQVCDIFIGMGYTIEEGPEVELDHFNFELLNVPKDHPARDMQDSFYIDETHLMRSQTSPVQAHVMLSKNGVGPIKIISPGKVYRRDDDATHSHQFGQIEGLVIDKNVNMGNLLSTLELFARSMFGEKREVRMRSSYFPFTEPSVEADISCFECGGKGCSLCKGTGWIEILGAGMVHPHVLEMCGFDTKEYQGFAFGIGIERVGMLKYGIDDIRRFYTNDVRFNKQFDKE
ncbi:MAG: phenylalanine--tRNA ligase subunit alpha [Bacilli bacterium]